MAKEPGTLVSDVFCGVSKARKASPLTGRDSRSQKGGYDILKEKPEGKKGSQGTKYLIGQSEV